MIIMKINKVFLSVVRKLLHGTTAGGRYLHQVLLLIPPISYSLHNPQGRQCHWWQGGSFSTLCGLCEHTQRESVWSVCFCYRHFAFRRRFDYVLQVCLLQNNYRCRASFVFRWWWPWKLEYLKPKTSVHTSYLVSGLLGQRWWKSCQQLSALQKLVGRKKLIQHFKNVTWKSGCLFFFYVGFQ